MKEPLGVYRRFKELGLLPSALFVLGLIGIALYFRAISIEGGDFASFVEGATKMLHGENIYDPPYIHLRYSYSPFWAMVLMPLALFPPAIGIFIWLVICVILLCRSIYLLRDYFDVRLHNVSADRVLWFLIMFFMSRFIELNFHHAQMTIFLLWVMLESIRLSDIGKDFSAGLLIGCGIIIKIMPLVMLPYFIYRGKFKAALWSLLVMFIAFFLPIIYVGRERFDELNRSWFQILRPDSTEFQTDNVWYFPQNLSALLYRLLMKIDAPYVRNIVSLDYTTATKFIWAIIGILIIGTVFFLGTRPFEKNKSVTHTLYELSYISLLIPLIFPHQMKYAFYFLLPAICFLMKQIAVQYKNGNKDWRYYTTVTIVILSFVLCTMTTDLIIGMRLSLITQHLKTITVGTLLLILALALNKKRSWD